MGCSPRGAMHVSKERRAIHHAKLWQRDTWGLFLEFWKSVKLLHRSIKSPTVRMESYMYMEEKVTNNEIGLSHRGILVYSLALSKDLTAL